MVDEENAKVLQEKYMQYQTMHEQVNQMQQQLMKMDEQVVEVHRILEGLEDLENTKGETELLAPISNGIFVRTKITDTDKLLVNVGANTVVEKTKTETVELLKKQITLITESKKQGDLQVKMLVENLGAMENELKTLTQ